MLPSGPLVAALRNASAVKHKAMLGLQRSLNFSSMARLNRRFAEQEGFPALMHHGVPDPERLPFIDPAGVHSAASVREARGIAQAQLPRGVPGLSARPAVAQASAAGSTAETGQTDDWSDTLAR
jgi:hypothetical protein